MHARYGLLSAYVLALLACAGWLAARLDWVALAWPPTWAWLMFPLLQLLVWHYNFPTTTFGMLSMERVPQMAALCLFAPASAATLNAVSALCWPFLNRRYRSNSWSLGGLRALHNASMTWLMTLAAGGMYAHLGGALPVHALDSHTLVALVIAALTLQAVNNVLILFYYALEGRDIRQLLTARFLLMDLLFVPFGILLAVIVATHDGVVVVLFLALVIVFVYALNRMQFAALHVRGRLDTLDAVHREISQPSDARRVDAVLEGLYGRMCSMFHFRVAYLALHEPSSGTLDVRVEVVDGRRLPLAVRPDNVGLVADVLRAREPVLIDDWASAPPQLRERAVHDPDERPGCVLIVPMLLGDRVLGVASIQHPTPFFYSKADKNALLALADDASAMLADAQTFDELDANRRHLEERVQERTRELRASLAHNAALVEELRLKGELLERQSREDALTGIANRRQFDEWLQASITKAQRDGGRLCLLLIDLDHFKQVNDSVGHAAGDAVLRAVAALMRSHIRPTDLLARIGGEEFALLLPGMDAHAACTVGNHLRVALHDGDSDTGVGGPRVTMSVGVAEWRQGMNSDALMREADQAMYRSKAQGRNRVSVALPG